VIVTGEAIARSRRLDGQMASTMLGSALRQVLPFAAAGLVVTVAICAVSLASAWILPGLWLLLVALLGYSAALRLPRAMIWACRWYFLCGAAVLALAGTSGTLSPWLMGLPLAIGQVMVAFILHRGSAERDGLV